MMCFFQYYFTKETDDALDAEMRGTVEVRGGAE